MRRMALSALIMRTTRASGVVALVLAGFAVTHAKAEPSRQLKLADLLVHAHSSPKLRALRAETEAAHARVSEAARAWWPRLELMALAGPAPVVHCSPSPTECTSTSPGEIQMGVSDVFWRLGARASMPVYTFGKISAARDAAEAGVTAADALSSAGEADIEVDAARAYYTVKFAREIVLILDDGKENVEQELERIEAALQTADSGVTEADRFRLRALRAEVDSRLSEAHKLEETGMIGVRLVSGATDVVVDARPLEEVAFDLPTAEVARNRAQNRRPEARAANAGIRAAVGNRDLESARLLPDLVVVAEATLARDPAADDPRNAFAYDPLNVTSMIAGVGLRWTLDIGTSTARLEGARAEVVRARANADWAAAGMAAEASRAWAEARDARDRLATAKQGRKDARGWLLAVKQANSAGLAEPKEFVDALLQHFAMNVRLAQAIYDWNLGTFVLGRATGMDVASQHAGQ